MITNKYKVVHLLPNSTHPDGTVEDYDLKVDPGETTDLNQNWWHKKGIPHLMRKLDELNDEMQ